MELHVNTTKNGGEAPLVCPNSLISSHRGKNGLDFISHCLHQRVGKKAAGTHPPQDCQDTTKH